MSEPYYLILDHAVKEYFLPDGDKSTAIQLLTRGCSEAEDSPDLLCFNAGVLLLREEKPEEALRYFKKAASIHDIELYRAAVQRAQRLAEGKVGSFESYRDFCNSIIQGCRQRSPEVVENLQSLSELQAGTDLQRKINFSTQPFVSECLRKVAPDRAAAINKALADRSRHPDLATELHTLDLLHHPLGRIWNPFWRYGQNPGGQPAVQAWAATLDAARSGSAGQAEAAAIRFFALPQLSGDAGLALRRAGALLILQDPFFDSVRSARLKEIAQSNL